MTEAQLLAKELDNAVIALTVFQSDHLEAMEDRIRDVTAEQIARSRNLLPVLVERHDALGQLLAVTAANLKVLVSVFNLQPRTGLHLETGTETR